MEGSEFKRTLRKYGGSTMNSHALFFFSLATLIDVPLSTTAPGPVPPSLPPSLPPSFILLPYRCTASYIIASSGILKSILK
jgi:hypothetical protein